MKKILILVGLIISFAALADLGSDRTRNNYTGDGTTGTYSYTFKIFDTDELLVTVENTSTNVLYTLLLTQDYTVTGAGETAGGSIVLVDSSQEWLDADGDLDSNHKLTIRRNLGLVQETDIRNQRSYFPATHEDKFDYLTMIDQQQQDQLDRALKLPETVDVAAVSATISLPVSGDYYIKVNSTADGFEFVDHATHTFDGLSPAKEPGDIIVSNGTNNVSMTVGDNGQVLVVDTTSNTKLDWASIEINSVTSSSLTAKGDLLTYDGANVDTLVIGGNDRVLVADDGATEGIRWAVIDITSISTLSTSGDIYTYNSDTSSTEPLAVGINDRVLTADDGSDRGVSYKVIDITSVTNLTTKGDIFVFDGVTSSTTRLGIGTNDQLLTADDGANEGLKWVTIDIDSVTPLTTAGDLIVTDGTNSKRLAVGSNDQALVADDGATDGVRWATINLASISTMSLSGDLLTYKSVDGTNQSATINAGGATQVLTVSSTGELSWEDGAGAVTIKSDGDDISTNATTIDFVGSAVYPGGSGTSVTVSLPRQSAFYNILVASNYDLENNDVSSFNVTTTAPTITTTSVAFGGYSLEWNPAAVDELSTASITVPSGLSNSTCEARVFQKGGDANYSMKVVDGSVDIVSLIIASTTNYKQVSSVFPCPSSGTLAIEFESNGAGDAIYLDDFYLGEALPDVNSEVATAWESFTPTGSWTTNTTYTGFKRRVGDTLEVEVKLALAGAPNATTLEINLPSGLTIDTNKISADTDNGVLGVVQVQDNGAGYVSQGMRVQYLNTTQVTFVSDANNAVFSNTIPVTFAANDEIFARFSVPISGWGTIVNVIPASVQGWYIDVNIGGANPALGTSSSSSYTVINDGSLDLVVNSGSKDAEIPCVTGESPSGLTCTGDESLGVAFTPPVAGVYEVCGEFATQISTGASGIARNIFQFIETNAGDYTILQEGGGRVQGAHNVASTVGEPNVRLCGTFNFTDTGKKVIRLMSELLVSGTVSSNIFLADRIANHGQRDFHITVKPVAPYQAAPKLIGSVHTPADDTNKVYKLVSAKFAVSSCGSGKASAVTQEYGDWIETVDSTDASVCNVAFKPNTFSAAPNCQCTSEDTNSTSDFCHFPNGSGPAITTVSIYNARHDALAESNILFLTCHGPGY